MASETIYQCVHHYDLYPCSSGAKWSRRWTPRLRSCARLIRLAFRSGGLVAMPSSIRKAYQTAFSAAARPSYTPYPAACHEQPAPRRLRSPCPPPRRGPVFYKTQCRPPLPYNSHPYAFVKMSIRYWVQAARRTGKAKNPAQCSAPLPDAPPIAHSRPHRRRQKNRSKRPVFPT